MYTRCLCDSIRIRCLGEYNRFTDLPRQRKTVGLEITYNKDLVKICIGQIYKPVEKNNKLKNLSQPK